MKSIRFKLDGIKEKRNFFMISDFEKEPGKNIELIFLQDLAENVNLTDSGKVESYHPEEEKIFSQII